MLLQLLLEKRYGPVRMRIAEVLRRPSHQVGQLGFGLLGQERRATAPVLVGQCRRVRFAGKDGRPMMDTLTGHAEHGGDVDGGSSAVELENGQDSPVRASVRFHLELLTETTAFPVLQFQPAHLGLLLTRKEK